MFPYLDLRLDGNSGTGRVGGGDPRSHHSIVSLARRADVDEALEERAFCYTDRCVITSPIKEPSLLMFTRSLASMLPCTAPRTTTSRAQISADTCPSRPTVTRLPGK